MGAFFCPFHFRKTYPKTANYGKIAVSSKHHSKEQIANQAEAGQGSSVNTILIFCMADVSEGSGHITGSKQSQSIIIIQDLTNKSQGGASLLPTRRMWR